MEWIDTLPDQAEFLALHQTTGWNAEGLYSKEQLYKAICNSWYAISVYEKDELIGFGRIISDGVYQTFICDVMVHPGYQNQGIGRTIIKKLLKKCEDEGMKKVHLFSAKGKYDFYKKLGFREREQEAPGMSISL
jgi:N-acetylglutamate synthase-like GNAT family acetyltransferase